MSIIINGLYSSQLVTQGYWSTGPVVIDYFSIARIFDTDESLIDNNEDYSERTFDTMGNIFYQDDGDKRYYCMDFSQKSEIDSTNNITGLPTITHEVRGGFDSDLIIEDEIATTGNFVCMWISGGTINKTYKLEITINAEDGTKVEGDGYIRIGN